MITQRELVSTIRNTCATHLLGWYKYRSFGLYRKTEDFVQWLFFESSRYNPTVVPHYGIQALAEQFPAESLTLGDRIKNEQGGDLWIDPSAWIKSKEKLVESITNQIIPDAYIPLTPEAIVAYLEKVDIDHISKLTTLGIAYIIHGDINKGRYCLQQAISRYIQIGNTADLAIIQAWFSASGEILLENIRRDAHIGASLLRLKPINS